MYPDWNSRSFGDCKGRHKAISIKAPDLLWRLCNVMVLQVRLICELKPTQHFGVKFWRVKQRSRPEKLSGLSRNVPNNTSKLIITPPTWFVTYWSRHYTCTYLILESLCKTMLSFSSILGSSPLCWSRFTAVLNHSSFEQLSRNAAVKAEKR